MRERARHALQIARRVLMLPRIALNAPHLTSYSTTCVMAIVLTVTTSMEHRVLNVLRTVPPVLTPVPTARLVRHREYYSITSVMVIVPMVII